MKKIFTLQEAEDLSLGTVKDLYNKFVNPYQTKILSNFPFGSDSFSKAEGMYVYTKDNKKILDFTGGLGVLNHGHNHPRILKARKEYAEKSKMEVHKLVFSNYLAALSSNLAAVIGNDLEKVFLCNSGAEAVEGAIKLSSRFNKNKKYILSSNKSYHGKLIGSGSISGSYQGRKNFPKMENVKFFDFNKLSSLENELREAEKDGGVYAVIFEPFSATLLQSCSEEFIRGLKELKKKYNFVIICDEVYCAWYKCGYFFYFQKFENFKPDILLLSKSLGGGKSSISALISNSKIYEKVYGSVENANLHTTTYNGFGEECATAIEAINIMIEDNYEEKVKIIEKSLTSELNEILKKNKSKIKKFQGSGSLWGIEFNSFIDGISSIIEKIPNETLEKKNTLIAKLCSASICSELYSKFKILTFVSESKNSNYLYIAPSLIVDQDQIKHFFSSLDKVINSNINLNLANYLVRSVLNLIR
tara:strand:- start:358 stop:1779 length:1422 start_codon:yes stop_codon:yes gene_type:complete